MKMRWLFVALLVCNAGYLGYHLLSPSKASDSAVVGAASTQLQGESIKLLSEAIADGSAKTC